MAAPSRDRETLLDVVRALALVRVILWHALGWPIITYLVAAVPAMFFVTGSLLAKSLAHRPVREVLRDRLRRLLVPLAALAVVAYLAMALAYAVDPSDATRVPWRGMWLWFFPLADPGGSAWEGGYLSSPLWYMRALLWILLLSPLLVRGARNHPKALLFTLIAAVIAFDVAGRRNIAFQPMPDLVWQVGDIALYSVFVVLGSLHRNGQFNGLTNRQLLVGAAITGGAAALWRFTQPVPGGVVNNSHPMHLLVGAMWLCLLFAARKPLTALASRPFMSATVFVLSRRSLSIYLWHPAAIIVSYTALARVAAFHQILWTPILLLLVGCTTLLLVLVFGWIEDLAASKSAKLLPKPVGLRVNARQGQRIRHYAATSVTVAVVTLLVASVAPAQPMTAQEAAVVAARRPPVPSQAPARPVFSQATETEVLSAAAVAPEISFAPIADAPPALLGPAPEQLAAFYLGILDWWKARSGIDAFQIGISWPGEFMWTYSTGASQNGRPLEIDTPFDIGSITKTMTATLVFRLAEQGLIDLDSPLPDLQAAPGFTLEGRLTPRMLLAHRTGLVNYRDVPSQQQNPFRRLTPAEAVTLSGSQPLKFEPGTGVDYSSTNFLVLGLLVEQVTGRSYDELLEEQLLAPLALTKVFHSGVGEGNPNFATAGVNMTIDELVRWTTAAFHDRRFVNERSYAAMLDINAKVPVGAGTFGYCPCTPLADGRVAFDYVGHSGGTNVTRYYRPTPLVISINLTRDVWTEGRAEAVDELFQQLLARSLDWIAAEQTARKAAAEEAARIAAEEEARAAEEAAAAERARQAWLWAEAARRAEEEAAAAEGKGAEEGSGTPVDEPAPTSTPEPPAASESTQPAAGATTKESSAAPNGQAAVVAITVDRPPHPFGRARHVDVPHAEM